MELVPCNLCGGERFEPVYGRLPDRRHWLEGRFDVVRCADCGLVQTNPQPSPDAIGAYYPESYGPHAADENGTASGPLRLARAVVKSPYTLRYRAADELPAPPRAGARALDVGCSVGRRLAELAALGWEVWGVEPSGQAAEIARERLGVSVERIVVGRAEDADFPAGRFDLVTASHVVEHLHDPSAVLAKARIWLRDDGQLRISLPNVDSLESRLFGRLWFGLDLPRHLYHFSPRTLSAMLERCGFGSIRIVPEYQADSLAASVASVAGAVRRRRRPHRPSTALHYGVLPFAAAASGLGSGGAMIATARPS
jgi:2-polyprenyl-3-methyl-5-hydroxy-6-metoxy-1,4-benzoquinol methylase